MPVACEEYRRTSTVGSGCSSSVPEKPAASPLVIPVPPSAGARLTAARCLGRTLAGHGYEECHPLLPLLYFAGSLGRTSILITLARRLQAPFIFLATVVYGQNGFQKPAGRQSKKWAFARRKRKNGFFKTNSSSLLCRTEGFMRSPRNISSGMRM